MLGLRYALGFGKAFDLQDNKRSVRPRAPVWYRPKTLRCLSKYGFSKFKLQINRQYANFDVGLWTPIVGLPRAPGGGVALIVRSVGTNCSYVPKASIAPIWSTSPPSSLVTVLGRGLEIVFGRKCYPTVRLTSRKSEGRVELTCEETWALRLPCLACRQSPIG
ncbi:unnamed protein product [Prunus armeniaca]